MRCTRLSSLAHARRARRLRSAADRRSTASGGSAVLLAYALLGALLVIVFTERLAHTGTSTKFVYGAAFALDAAAIAALLAPALFQLSAAAHVARPLPRAVTRVQVAGKKVLAGCVGASLLLACRLLFAWPAGWPLACAAAIWFALCLGVTPVAAADRGKSRGDG